MSKRKRTSEIEQWIKQGRGTGIGVDYKRFKMYLQRVVPLV
nr:MULTISPECIES: hypothetical protein [unclassified Bacillus (in: firmicutes)]